MIVFAAILMMAAVVAVSTQQGEIETGGDFHACQCPYGHPCPKLLSPLYPFPSCVACLFAQCQK